MKKKNLNDDDLIKEILESMNKRQMQNEALTKILEYINKQLELKEDNEKKENNNKNTKES